VRGRLPTFALLTSAVLHAACTDPGGRSDTERSAPALRYASSRVELGDEVIATRACEVFRARREGGRIVGWDELRFEDGGGGLNKMLSGCAYQRVRLTSHCGEAATCQRELVITDCLRGFGAGGGCLASHRRRTLDGVQWWCESDDGSEAAADQPSPSLMQPCKVVAIPWKGDPS